MDEQSVDFHRSVRDAYLDLASKEPKRIIVIDARPDPDTVEKSIWDTLAPRLEGVHVL